IEKLFAFGDVAQRIDKDACAVFVLFGFAVRVAGVVDPAGVVAVLRSVNDLAATQGEIEGVERIVRVCRVLLVRFFGSDQCTGVLNDAGARGDIARGEYAVTMQGRTLHDMPGPGSSSH